MTPMVLVEIDADSRLRLLQTSGVRIVMVDRRVDPIATIFPEQHQYDQILDAVAGLVLFTPGWGDDLVRSAEAVIRRLRTGLVLVAGQTQEEIVGDHPQRSA